MENWIIYFIYFFFFYFGAIMGSFLNVVFLELSKIYDLAGGEKEEEGEDFSCLADIKSNFIFSWKSIKEEVRLFWIKMNRRSRCDSCGHNLAWFDLFPIFSYLWNRGKCRYCGKKITKEHFYIELGSGLVFLLVLAKLFQAGISFTFLFNFIFLTIIFSLIILIFLFDQKYHEIPAFILNFAIIISFLYIFYQNNFTYTKLLAVIIPTLLFFLIYCISREKWMGGGDWKIVLFLSILLSSALEIYSFMVLSFWIGAIYVMPRIIKKYIKKEEDEEGVPFGPFLIIGFFIVYIFNLNILNWFLII